MLNSIPVIGWMLSIGFSISVSIPFWFIWNRLAPVYFYWLPAVYQHLPFWDCVGLFVILSILKPTLTPQFASVSNTNNK